MLTKKQLRIQLYSAVGLLCLVLVVGGIANVRAFNTGEPVRTVIENANIEVFNQASEPVIENMELGAMSGPVIPYSYLSINDDVTHYIGSTLKDLTTTIVSAVNPFGTSATSTVEMARLYISGVATSTYTINCGASVDGTTAPTYTLIDSAEIATSSGIGVIENNIATAQNGNSAGIGGGSTAKITLTPEYPYFVCEVTTVYDGAFTEVTNTFAGTWRIRVSK